MDTKQDLYICYLQKTHFRPRDTCRLKVRGWKKIFHANGNQKKAGAAILISDNIDFKTKSTTREKEEHYIMIKGSIQAEDGIRDHCVTGVQTCALPILHGISFSIPSLSVCMCP